MKRKNNKVHVLFRADGNSEIGLGHVYRCLAIAERLGDYFDCYFAIRKPSNELKDIISNFANLIELDQCKSYNEEADCLPINVINKYKIDIITLDGYYFNTEYQKIIKEKCKSVLVSIDDDQPFHYVSDVVINHAGGVRAEQISKESYTKLFLGYNYLLLRKEFIQVFNKERSISGLRSVFICFGGADPKDFTGHILNCLKNEHNINSIVVVIGSSYTQTEKLKQSIADCEHVKVLSNLDAKTLAEMMNKIDLAIVPSSTIGLEAFASRMILVTGMTAENQKNIYKGLMQEDTVIGIGDFKTLTCTELLVNINKVSQKFNDYTFKKKININDSILEVFKSISL